MKRLSIFLITLLSLVSLSTYSQKNTPRAINIEGDWTEYIKFISNIGDKAEVFEDVLFNEILNLKALKKLKDYQSPENTRFVLSAYELQHRGIVDFVKKASRLGYKFLFVLDGNLVNEFKPLSNKELQSHTENQREYYYKTYDMDGDGVVSQADADAFNKKYEITRYCYSELKKLKPSQVKVVTSPHEIVPHPGLNYPRIHHLKEYTLQLYVDGKWVDQKSWIPSSNMTNTGQNHLQGRISNSPANILRYMRETLEVWDRALADKKITQASYDQFVNAVGEEKYRIAYAKTSIDPSTGKALRSGHVQVGMLFTDPLIIEHFKGDILEHWVKAYEKGKFFDEAQPRKSYLPQIIINDKNGHTSRLNAFASEGLQFKGAETDFVMRAYNQVFGDPGNILKVFKTSQFVMTHPKVLSKVRTAMMADGFEKAFMVVDGNFSSESYSAYPYFATSRINDQAMTPWTKSVDDNRMSTELKNKTFKSMFSFNGHQGIVGGADGIKLHAKFSYMEYVDSRGRRHYVVIQGSGNLSINAGKGNADVLTVFDTTDPRLKDYVDPYFDGLEKSPRTQPFIESYLRKRMMHVVKYNQKALKEVETKQFERATHAKYIDEAYELLNLKDGLLTVEFAALLRGEMSLKKEKALLAKIIETLKSKEYSNKSYYNKNLVSILGFYANLKNTPLRFEQFDHMLYMAGPQNFPYSGIKKRLGIDWLKRLPKDQQTLKRKQFKKILNSMMRFDSDHNEIILDPIARQILADCSVHFQKMGIKDKLNIKTKEVK